MRFKGYPNYPHNQIPKVGVLVTNLGTPNAPTAKALRPYLKQFLWDPRVVEIPRPLWWLILNGIILNLRPKKSAEAYKTVWTDRGSPLAFNTESQANHLDKKLKGIYGENVIVDWAMRYGQPSIDNALQKMQEAGVTRLVVLPLYPQYSGSTTGSTFDAVAQDFSKRRWLPELRFVNQYADHMPYITAVADSIRAYWQTNGRPDKLVFSFHGVPVRYLHQGDPYHCQCLKTVRLIVKNLGLTEDEYITCFQSRFGKAEWLKPYTDATLKQLPLDGVKNVHVVCPGFSSDCLETIEEIGEENREYFMEAGGESYHYIPALNDSEDHINALTSLVNQNIGSWLPQSGAGTDHDSAQQDQSAAKDRQSRFDACPFNK